MSRTFAELVADRFIIRQTGLSRVEEDTRQKVLGLLDDVQRDIESHLLNTFPSRPNANSFRGARLQAVQQALSGMLESTYDDILGVMEGDLYELSAGEALFAQQSVNTVVRATALAVMPSPEQLKRIVDRTLIEGAPMKDWVRGQQTATLDKMTRQLRIGATLGESVDSMVRRLIGTSTGQVDIVRSGKTGRRRRVAVRRGGVMTVSKREATALVRTSVQNVANRARLDLYEANEDVIGGFQAQVTLDQRTSTICQARSGQMWDLDKKPIGHDSPWPGNPPWHWNCRSTLIPILRSWSSLSRRSDAADDIAATAKDRYGDTWQSSMNGPVPGNYTYERWLESQSEAVQRKVLGDTKWAMWKKGGMSFSDMIDERGNPLPVRELESQFGNAAVDDLLS
jgi:SPP1 gp7 family putative phage head morphogenesis protein